LANSLTILKWIWGAFGAYWLGSALKAKKASTHEANSLRILRLVILAVTFVLLLGSGLRMGPLGWRFVPEFGWAPWTGIGVTVAGLLVCVWARRHLGAHWSDKVVLKIDHQLVQSGPYTYLRHPIYAGLLLGIAGTALAVGEWRGIMALILSGTNYFVKARREDRILAARFGEEFEAYRRRVGFLVPRI